MDSITTYIFIGDLVKNDSSGFAAFFINAILSTILGVILLRLLYKYYFKCEDDE